ncbi:NADP-dependent isocitrate dehydrogenase, partial [Streptomyces albidoflavus]
MLQTWSGAPVTDSTIIYTHTDEAPALATYSFLPVVGGGAAPPGGAGGGPPPPPGKPNSARGKPNSARNRR